MVGVGGLGSALAKSVLRSGFDPSQLLLIDRKPAEVATTCEVQGCEVVDRPPGECRLESGDLLVLAVKPQDAEMACIGVRSVLCPGAVVVSVMAGVSLARLRLLLDHTMVVRAMPNLGATVGQSATVYLVPTEITPADLATIENFLSCIGPSWRVQDERLIDAATAVAGSGPAYICWLAEQMESVACELGILDSEARALVLQTLKATTSSLESSNQTFAELRARVTSRGGTTAAALTVLEQRKADEIVQDAIKAAFARAQEIGQ
jgi:pyrroline-5-carboxylate reductase